METKLAKIGLVLMIAAVSLRFMLTIEPKKELYSLSENLSKNISASDFKLVIEKHRVNQRSVHFSSNYNKTPTAVAPIIKEKRVVSERIEEELLVTSVSSDFVESDAFAMFTRLNHGVENNYLENTEVLEPLESYNTINAKMSMFFPGR